jgi:hypothetical protein
MTPAPSAVIVPRIAGSASVLPTFASLLGQGGTSGGVGLQLTTVCGMLETHPGALRHPPGEGIFESDFFERHPQCLHLCDNFDNTAACVSGSS